MRTAIHARPTVSLMLAFILLLGTPSWAHEKEFRTGQIRAMTQNLYVGADLFRILSVTSPAQVPAVVSEIYNRIRQTDFLSRADAIADKIRKKRPDVIGLQEVSLIRTQSPSDYFIGNPNTAETVTYDYLQILLVALAKRGLHYRVASKIQNADIELPAITGFDGSGMPLFSDVRLTDRDVILVRKGIETSQKASANFQVNLQVPIAGNVIVFTRGYTSVNAKARGKRYRLVNTHLEVNGKGQAAAVQAIQAQELIGALAIESAPIVLLGDLNSSPADTIDPATGVVPPYMQFRFSGYHDSWRESRNVDQPGFTCCHTELLISPMPELYERVDYVLFRTEHLADTLHKTRVHVDVIGDVPSDRTATGLWPSDHAGVYARIRFPVSVRRYDQR